MTYTITRMLWGKRSDLYDLSEAHGFRRLIQSACVESVNLPIPSGDVASPDNRTWWQTVSLTSVERLRVQHDLETLDHLANHINEVNVSLAHLSVCVLWSEDVPLLLQMLLTAANPLFEIAS